MGTSKSPAGAAQAPMVSRRRSEAQPWLIKATVQPQPAVSTTAPPLAAAAAAWR